MLASMARARISTSAGPISDSKRNGSRSCGQRQLLGQAVDLLGLERDPVQSEVGGRGQRLGLPRQQRHRAASAASTRVDVEVRRSRRRAPLTTTGPRPTPTSSSSENAVSTSSFTGVSSGSVTSTTWQRSWSSSRSSTSRAWLLIGPTFTASSSPRGRAQERDGVAGGGGVEDEHVGRLGPLQLLDLAQHEDVADAGGGGGDDVERSGRHQALGDPGQPVILEVLEQGAVGRDGAGPDVGRTLGPAALVEHEVVVPELVVAEHPGQARLALDLDHEGRPAGQRRGPSHGRGDHRFAHATFPGNDEQPRCSEVLRRIHRFLSTTAGLVAGTEPPYPGSSPASSSW